MVGSEQWACFMWSLLGLRSSISKMSSSVTISHPFASYSWHETCIFRDHYSTLVTSSGQKRQLWRSKKLEKHQVIHFLTHFKKTFSPFLVFKNHTWRLSAERKLLCCLLKTWISSPSVTECLRRLCFSSSRTNHPGCSFSPSLKRTCWAAVKSSKSPGLGRCLFFSSLSACAKGKLQVHNQTKTLTHF